MYMLVLRENRKTFANYVNVFEGVQKIIFMLFTSGNNKQWVMYILKLA